MSNPSSLRLFSRDRIIALCVIVVCVLLYFEADDYPAGGSLFPHFALAASAVLAAAMLAFSFAKHVQPALKSADNAETERDGHDDPMRRWRPLIMIGIFFVYLTVMPSLGFYATTLVFIYGVMLFLRIRGTLLYALAVPLIMLSLYAFFGLLLKVPFPDSLLI